MTKGKKRSRDEPEDPNPRPVKRQETGDAMGKMDQEFQQINDDCIKRAIIRINNKLFANLDVLDKIQQQVQERGKSPSKNKPDIPSDNKMAISSDPLSRNTSEKSSQTSKANKKRGKLPKKLPYQVKARYTNGKKALLTPQVHKMPPVEGIPTSTTWAPISKNYPVVDDREKRFVPYYSDEEDRDHTELDALYDKRFFNLEDHESDNILEGYILKYGTKDQNQILPDDKMKYLTDILECDAPADLRKYLVEKTNYVKLFCQNNSNKAFDPREYDGTLAAFFCRRCYTTVCPYHNTFDKEFHHFNQNEKNVVITDEVAKPCGEHCFANETNPTNNNAKDVWTERDVIMFNKAKIIFSTACQMQKVIRTKTCQQIYDRLIKKGLVNNHFDDEDEDEESKQPPKKKLTRINRSRKDSQKFDATYSPCSHPGFPCGPDVFCPCFQNGTYCEKYCSCPADCERKFPGCNCSSVKNPCIKTLNTSCLCVQEMRECDPDICRCKCDCYNALVLTEKQKKVSVRRSKVAGWGLFADTKIKAGEFVAEYKGDLISLDESERRGWIYDERKINFLFGLHNSGYVVDATRKGNKMKYANHSRTPNVNSCIESVLGELRIIMRAGRDIEPDEELFIDYGYSKDYFKRIDSENNKASRKQGVKKASVKETTENSEENSTSEAQQKNKKKSVYRNAGDEDKEDTKKKDKVLPVINLPDEITPNNSDVTSARSVTKNLPSEDNPTTSKIKQRKVTAPKLHYKKGPPVVDLDSEMFVKREAPVQCLSSGEEDTVADNGVVDVEDQEVEYIGKFVDVQSVESD